MTEITETNHRGVKMTVQQAIDELLKLKDKSVPLYFDCAFCNRANEFQTPTYVVVVKAQAKKDEIEYVKIQLGGNK
jgi:hypothetical protein